MSKSHIHKRLKLDPSVSPSPSPGKDVPNPSDMNEIACQDEMTSEDEVDHCVICLQHIRDRTLLPCAHDRMCFECILVWTAQSRKCPLCNAPIGPFLIHNMRSKYDYQKRYLPPLRSSSPPTATPLIPLQGGSVVRNRGGALADRWGARSRRRSASRERQDLEDELELAVSRRKWVYRHNLFAKHVASNPYTRYRPAPTPAQFATSPDLVSRAMTFVRRELRIWVNLDVEFLTTFILSLMKSLDLRSESAVKLLAEFLDMDTPYHVGSPSESVGRFINAEHFAHELYSYLRSPYRDLAVYDSAVQYDLPEHTPPAPSQSLDEPRRWEPHSSTHDETSPSHRRRDSSPSPLSRSPRDAYSRSPSPVYSDLHEEYAWHPSTSVDLVRNPQTLATDATNGRDREAINKDKKGKSKEVAYPAPDDGVYYREPDNQSRQIAVHAPSRKRSRSPGPTSAVTRRERSPTSGLSQNRRPPSGTSSLPRRYVKDIPDHCGGRSTPDSYSKSTTQITSRAGRNNSVDVPPCQDVTVSGDRQPVPSPVESETIWGISIKGQAKLLKPTLDASGEHNPRDPQEFSLDGSEDKDESAQRGFVDIKQTAHIDRDCRTGMGLPEEESAVDSSGACIAYETQNGETLTGKSLSRRNDHTDPSDFPSKLSTRAHRSSVPEIMARARAKIVRLRGQLSAAGAASSSDVVEGPSEGTPESLSLRARLLERLEEERTVASTTQGGARDTAQVSRLKGDDFEFGGSTAPKANVVKSTVGEGIRIGVTTDSQKAEARLRARALLQVRLGAEKRRYEEEKTTSREEALRAKLLSRRA